MDWATFIKDNSQSLFTLGGVFLGSLITFLISYFNNRFEAQERDTDRQEQKKEAKIQLVMELKRNDIRNVEDSIDDYLKGVGEMRRLRIKHSNSDNSKNEMMAEFGLRLEEDSFYKLIHRNMMADKLAYSFGEDFYSEYRSYVYLFRDYFDYFLTFTKDQEKDKELSRKLVASAGRLHNMLEEKLVSIREAIK